MDMRVSEFAVAEAKARLSELLTRAESGEDIVIKRHGRPIVRLTKVQADDDRRREKAAAFVEWVKARPVHARRIDYKALINEGRR